MKDRSGGVSNLPDNMLITKITPVRIFRYTRKYTQQPNSFSKHNAIDGQNESEELNCLRNWLIKYNWIKFDF